MKVTFDIFVGQNSHVFMLRNVRNMKNDELINDAVVLLRSVDDISGVTVSGVSFPLVMPSSGDGEYSVTVPSSADFQKKTLYKAYIVATAIGGIEGEWRPSTVAKERI